MKNVQRVVLDTCVMTSGLMSRQGASYQLLSILPKKSFVFLLSVPLFFEYEAVLKRDNILQGHGLSFSEIDILLHMWAKLCEPVLFHYLWRPQLKDPDDEMVLETAVNGQADAIVTFNRNDFHPHTEAFGVQLLTPGTFLKMIRRIP